MRVQAGLTTARRLINKARFSRCTVNYGCLSDISMAVEVKIDDNVFHMQVDRSALVQEF
jgi:hypothetical protein